MKLYTGEGGGGGGGARGGGGEGGDELGEVGGTCRFPFHQIDH